MKPLTVSAAGPVAILVCRKETGGKMSLQFHSSREETKSNKPETKDEKKTLFDKALEELVEEVKLVKQALKKKNNL